MPKTLLITSKIIFPFLLIQLLSCSQISEDQLIGTWVLEEVQVDKLERPISPQFLVFKEDHIFSVSTKDGDLNGFYRIEENNLRLQSEHRQWYNGDWKLRELDQFLLFEGKSNYIQMHREGEKDLWLNTRLYFRKVEQIPSR